MHVINRDNIIRSLVIIILSIGILHCERNDYVTLPYAKLAFSTDTILFDTVITNIAGIYLAGGQQSVFRLNVNGTPTSS